MSLPAPSQVGHIDNQLCDQCMSLHLSAADFLSSPREEEDRAPLEMLYYVRELRERTACPLCRLIHELIRLDSGANPPPEDLEFWLTWMNNDSEYFTDLSLSGLYICSPQGTGQDYRIELLSNYASAQPTQARSISHEKISLEQIQQWLQKCQEWHGFNCRDHGLSHSTHPSRMAMAFRVIDVQTKCLVFLPPGADYVALSYVWGEANTVTTTLDTLEVFSEANGLRVALPCTIADAIYLTQVLGQRYIWIDCLCIVQNESSAKESIISNMDSIYSYAFFTIVAATGKDADAGLPGLREGSMDLRRQRVESLTNELKLCILPSWNRQLPDSTYAHRAWTFQEGCFSRRCLVFLDGQCYFMCRAAFWREDVMAEHRDIRFGGFRPILGRAEYAFPLQLYAELVQIYTERTLTYPADMLHAFAGLETALGRYLNHSKMWYGLPSGVFDWSMLWKPKGPLKRRPGFFSWTWVGWEGAVIFPPHLGPEPEHHRLLKHTWIAWWIWNGPSLRSVWDPELDGSLVSVLVQDDCIVDQETDKNPDDETESTVEEIDETEDSEGDDDERCPSYGQPQPGNLYGRLPQPERFKVWKPNEQSEYLNSSDRPASGTLQFSTLTGIYNIRNERPFYHPSVDYINEELIYPLLDKQAHTCGLVYVHDPESFFYRLGDRLHVELLLLSDASPGETYLFNSKGFEWPNNHDYTLGQEGEISGEYILGQWHSWNMFNVMLVLPVGQSDTERVQLYERCGLGLLHRKAIDNIRAEGLCWKQVMLV
ncbi:hypothetical protein MMC32_005722 [Xylographa parallela]|nr:hypothetical protein [Xylographa parallela]